MCSVAFRAVNSANPEFDSTLRLFKMPVIVTMDGKTA